MLCSSNGIENAVDIGCIHEGLVISFGNIIIFVLFVNPIQVSIFSPHEMIIIEIVEFHNCAQLPIFITRYSNTQVSTRSPNKEVAPEHIECKHCSLSLVIIIIGFLQVVVIIQERELSIPVLLTHKIGVTYCIGAFHLKNSNRLMVMNIEIDKSIW